MIKNKNFHRYVSALSLLGGTTLLASAVKFNFLVGSDRAFFSLVNSVVPLSGMIAGTSGIFFLSVLRLLYSLQFASAGVLVNFLPNLVASAYAMSNSRILRAVIPFLCIILFLIHPIGQYAAVYTLYWILPTIYPFLSYYSLLLHFLATTLTAHAVGSVIWLYTTQMSASLWIALIPIVFIERLCITAGMFFMYKIFTAILRHAAFSRPAVTNSSVVIPNSINEVPR